MTLCYKNMISYYTHIDKNLNFIVDDSLMENFIFMANFETKDIAIKQTK